jgi:argininosuccinate lyase
VLLAFIVPPFRENSRANNEWKNIARDIMAGGELLNYDPIRYYDKLTQTLQMAYMSHKNKKAWSGRFTESTHPLVEALNASLPFDHRLYRHDIRGSIAHANMLAAQKIIPKKDAAAIVQGLREIESQIDSGEFSLRVEDEDIHMAIERRLIEKIGPAGGKLHTARSRNDQVATDFRLYVLDAIDETISLIRQLQRAFVEQAKKHLDTVAPAYTHLQPAQPIRFAHWFLAYYEMFDRDAARLRDARVRVDVMPLGSAALAGANYPIDRAAVAAELGFAALSQNSLDAVSDRDFAVEFLFCVSMIGTHLSRLAEELVIWSSAEFRFIELPDAFCTGSSIMPQKKNPDVPELLRAKTGRFNGHLIALLTILKGLPLAYNKDLQEDKEPVFDAHDQVALLLSVTADMVQAMRVDTARLAARAEEGFMTAVDVADGLVMDGVPFRDAHELVGRLVRLCVDGGKKFADLTDEEIDGIDPRLRNPVKGAFSPELSADRKTAVGAAGKMAVKRRLTAVEKEMETWNVSRK